ncbi:uncharacterized protein LOC115161224 isoform X2 [Salmo trutta]|uniref:uncharacterized protein LOC115161224 isoform X2 n=1 Tax=Salmo trutta TaxID=8032 RepID=UPI00113114A6|nr:uncharacterized protein LOC115161224 isoform X2 [Salmo trutta]
MMDHKRALTISLAVDKMGSPLKIPKTLLSSELRCGNEESQIHWTQIAGNRIKLQKSCQQNGSISLDHGQAALGQAAMDCTQLQLVLTDVLKTEQGQAYLDRKMRGKMTGIGERKRESRMGSGQRRVSQSSRDGREDCRDFTAHRKRPHDHPTPTSTPIRKERRSHHRWGSEEDEEVKELLIGEENIKDQRCNSSVSGRHSSWEPLEEVTFTEGDMHQEKPYPQSTRTRKAESGSRESTHVERESRRRESGLYSNGQVKAGGMKDGVAEGLTTDASRSSRGSVLRLSRDARGKGGLPSKQMCLEGMRGIDTNVASIEVEADPSNFDGTLMVVTVGEDREVASPSNTSCGGVKERRGTLRLGLSSSQDRTPKLSPVEPIVLSSDEDVVTPSHSSVLWPQTSESESQRNHAQTSESESQRNHAQTSESESQRNHAQTSESESQRNHAQTSESESQRNHAQTSESESQRNHAQTSESESQRNHAQTSESESQRNHAQEDNVVEETDFQVMPVAVTGFGVANFPSTEDSEGMVLTFSALHCGGVEGRPAETS